MLSMTLLWWLGAGVGWAQPERCVCPDEDAAAIFARAAEVYIARTGDSIQSELTPMLALKGELPERTYLSDTWEACDLEPGPPGGLMLVVVDEVGHMSRCGGAGPLPTPGLESSMSAEQLRSWLRYGGWLAEPPDEAFVLEVVERELSANPLQYGEQGVAIENFADVDARLESGAPIRSLKARVPGPRWMSLDVMAGPGDVYYIGWHHEQGASGAREVWKSHSLWRREPSGKPVPLWRVESPHTPVLDAAPGERIGIEPLAAPPRIAAFDDRSAVAVLPGRDLFAIRLDPQRGWKPPETLSDGDASDQVTFAAGDAAAVVAWVEGDVLRSRRYTPADGWSETRRLAEPPAADPLLAVNDRGAALLAWTGLDGLLWTRQMGASGEWGAPEAIAERGATEVSISLSDSGRALVTWVQDEAVRARVTNHKGRWERPRALSYEKGGAHPSGAIDRWGRAVVVWAEGTGSRRELYVRTLLPVRGWSAEPEKLMTNRRGAVGPPAVVMSDAGGATVFWLQEGSRGQLWARHYTLRRGWASPEQRLLPGSVNPGQRPEVVLHDDGTISAAWVGDRSAWTCRYRGGAGFERVAAFEELDPPVQGIGIDGYIDSGTMFIWSQGAADPMEVWVREQPEP